MVHFKVKEILKISILQILYSFASKRLIADFIKSIDLKENQNLCLRYSQWKTLKSPYIFINAIGTKQNGNQG